MKVLHAFLKYGNKTEPWSFNLLKELANHGNEITVAASNYAESDFYDDRFTYLRNPFQKISLPFNLNRYINRFYHFFWLKNIIDNVDIDLIHTHFGPAGWRYRNAAKKKNVPLIISFYGKDYESIPYNKPIWKERYKILFEEATAFVCEGEHGKKTLIQMGCPAEKVFVVHLGIVPRNIPLFPRKKEKNKLRIVQIASFVEKKGQIYSVKAFHQALKDCPNMELVMVGKPYDAFAEVQTYIKENQLEDEVKHIPFIEYSKLYEFLGDFDVFIHPSCYATGKDCEGGAPVVLLDAQATGMPVIATTHCDIPEEVVHNVTGLLTKEKNVQELTNSIIRMYKMDDTVYKRMALAARQHVEADYDINKNAMELATIYNRVLS